MQLLRLRIHKLWFSCEDHVESHSILKSGSLTNGFVEIACFDLIASHARGFRKRALETTQRFSNMGNHWHHETNYKNKCVNISFKSLDTEIKELRRVVC